MSRADEVLQKLAFQRGVLTLLKEAVCSAPGIEKAIEDIDSLIEDLAVIALR